MARPVIQKPQRRTSFLVFGNPLIEEPEIQEVVETLRSGWIGTGPKVQRFETMFSQYKGARFAIALNSGTAALHLSLLAAGIKPGDEVITTSLTFCATVNAIIHAGARPVLADCERTSLNIDPRDIERRITPRVKAILPVHFAGRLCNMPAIMDIAQRHNLKVIEDCAHAIETKAYGRASGTWGDFGCFSFYVTKNIVTAEGGMVITSDETAAERIRRLSLHGMSHDAWKRFRGDGYKHYQILEAGFKYNMTDLAASLGIRQLQRIDAYWARRQQIWEYYNEMFQDLPLILPEALETLSKHAYHLYTVLVDTEKTRKTRDQIMQALTHENIGVGVHYIAIHLHHFYAQTFGYKPEDFPNATFISERTLSLPLSPKLTDEDVEDVVRAVRKVLD